MPRRKWDIVWQTVNNFANFSNWPWLNSFEFHFWQCTSFHFNVEMCRHGFMITYFHVRIAFITFALYRVISTFWIVESAIKNPIRPSWPSPDQNIKISLRKRKVIMKLTWNRKLFLDTKSTSCWAVKLDLVSSRKFKSQNQKIMSWSSMEWIFSFWNDWLLIIVW